MPTRTVRIYKFGPPREVTAIKGFRQRTTSYRLKAPPHDGQGVRPEAPRGTFRARPPATGAPELANQEVAHGLLQHETHSGGLPQSV
jgi:hypothetical protein